MQCAGTTFPHQTGDDDNEFISAGETPVTVTLTEDERYHLGAGSEFSAAFLIIRTPTDEQPVDLFLAHRLLGGSGERVSAPPPPLNDARARFHGRQSEWTKSRGTSRAERGG